MSVNDIIMGIRLVSGLPTYFGGPLTITESRLILRRRLERREEDFLDFMRRSVLANPASPYIPLFRQAGCEPGDLERLVRRDGLEGALQALFRAGIYLTADEYKGRRAVVRGNFSRTINPMQLRNPLMVPHYLATTSGSRGEATHVPLDIACIRDRAVNVYLALAARGGVRWHNAVWMIPGIGPVLWYSSWARPVARWFWPIPMEARNLPSRYRWSARLVVWTSRLAGTSIPSPEPVSPDSPLPIARWMAKTIGDGKVPHVWGYPSSALRLCREALNAGVHLAGSQFTLTGEPVTEACLSAIRRVGAEAVPDYGSADSGGSVGQGCLSPGAPDDIHIFSDLNALIQADGPPFPPRALLLTSIRPTAPFVFLNVSMGDVARMSERRCGCPMEKLGWPSHIQEIRSFEKLTIGGMTFLDADIIRILEEILPRKFGGGPSEYQLVEESMTDGPPRLRLLIHPSVPAVDPVAVSETFWDALGTGSATRRLMALQLKRGGFLDVERQPPLATFTGKILHVRAGTGVSPGGFR